jgi:glycosyltransferase 2 family protein
VVSPTVLNTGALPKRRTWRSVLSNILIYGVSLGCLVWVFTGVNWNELGRLLRHADVRWMIIAALFEFVSDTYHAWRWNLLLRPVSRLRLWRTVQALYVGLFANEILPLRPGEVVRSYLLAKWNGIAFSVVVSSVALERLLDGVSLAVIFSVVSMFLKLPSYLITGVRVMAVILAVVALLLLLFVWRMQGGMDWLPRRMERLRRGIEGVHRMASARSLALCVGASLVQLAFQGGPYWFLNKSCGFGLSIWAVIAVLIIVRTATIIPNAPGNAGVLQMACVLALGLFEVGKTRATAFAALLFLVITVPLVITGAIIVAASGTKLRDLSRTAAKLEATDAPAL